MPIRSIVIVATLLGAAAAAEAQGREFGAKAGPSFGMLGFEPDQSGSYDHRVSADGGGFAVLPLTRAVALQLEALFTSRGAKLYDPEEDLTGAILLQYFELPALLRVKGPAWGSRSVHVFGGPYAGFRLSAKREVSFYANSIKTGNKEEIDREIEAFQFGVLAGAGLDIGRRLVIDGRYSHGLTPLNTDRSDGVRIRSSAFSIMAGMRF
jgi:hypothetical protein